MSALLVASDHNRGAKSAHNTQTATTNSLGQIAPVRYSWHDACRALVRDFDDDSVAAELKGNADPRRTCVIDHVGPQLRKHHLDVCHQDRGIVALGAQPCTNLATNTAQGVVRRREFLGEARRSRLHTKQY